MSDVVETSEITELPAENAKMWSLYLHRRIIRLLLIHDPTLFQGKFRVFFANSSIPAIPWLQLYDRYLKLVLLSGELFDDILPRIRRQLSLQTNHTSLQEEAPTRGDIDWQLTIEHNLSQTPTMPPLQFETRLRQRDINTPENILVVAILLSYRQTLQTAQQEEFDDEVLSIQEKQTLVELDERSERELAAPYAHALLEVAQQAGIESLIEQVLLQLRPGANPYQDLISWWELFHALHIGRALDSRQLVLASQRSDEKVNAWLYEIWIALEIVHLLQDMGAIQTSDITIETDQLQFTFEWNKQRFRFRYNRQTNEAFSQALGWKHAPAVQPDYTIERVDPLYIRHEDTLIWHEPPVILDAKYFLTGSDPTNIHEAIKKMLGDMHLLDAQYGVLLLPLLPDPPTNRHETREITRQRVGSTAEIAIRLYKLFPNMEFDLLHSRLKAILDYATQNLPEREPLACHGVRLDPDSINISRSTMPIYNILCPKRHIGPDVFMLVNDREHCLKDPYRCHVMGQSIVPPIVIRATTLDGVQEQSNTMRTRSDDLLEQAEKAGNEERAEQLRSHIFVGVGRTIEQYVKLRGDTISIEEKFEEWTFAEYWKKHSRCLAEETRNMLLSGEYVWNEYAQTKLEDWAAPAVQYCRALETEIKRRLYDHCPTQYRLSKGNPHLTLGSITYIYDNRNGGDSRHNWQIFTDLVRGSHSDINEFTSTS